MSKRKKHSQAAHPSPSDADTDAEMEPTTLSHVPEQAEEEVEAGESDEAEGASGESAEATLVASAEGTLDATALDAGALDEGTLNEGTLEAAATNVGASSDGDAGAREATLDTVAPLLDADDVATLEFFAVGEVTAAGGPVAPVAPADEAVDEAVDEALDEGTTMEVSFDAPAAADEGSPDTWGEEPTRVAEAGELAELAAQSAAEPAVDDGEPLAVDSESRLESIIESLLFAADRPLALADLKRLVNERDTKKLTAALETLQARHQDTGIQLASSAGGWQFRTNPENASWVAKLVAGRPARLSRAMLETLAIVAYRQPITRPEIDEIRGVDCGPVLKTLLDRTLIRMIGKKEEVGRPILYGTTPEFLRTFSLKDLTEMPTLRQFHELGVAEQAKVDAEAPAKGSGPMSTSTSTAAAAKDAGPPRAMPAPTNLPEHDPDEEDALLAELDDATASATRATRPPEPPPPPTEASEASE